MSRASTPEGHRCFAAVYDRLSAAAEKSFMRAVREKVVGAATGRVLELGAGTGLNFPYYGDAVESVIAVEPDPFMARRAEPRAAERTPLIELRALPAEDLPFADDSFDTIVCTLVLCSVDDQGAVLREAARVLRAGGKFLFYEHVRSERPFGAFWQDAVTPVWHRLGGGCRPNRDTVAAIRAAGFEIEELEPSTVGPPVPPIAVTRPHVRGVARPRGSAERT